MSTLLIEGGRRLSGAVAVEGNKNAALPLLAACLLTTEECVLTNVPRIRDVEVMARLLDRPRRRGRGHRHARRCASAAARSSKDEPDARWSAGCAARCCCSGRCSRGAGRARLAPPGGDFPARRTIATHLDALVAMGARVVDGTGHISSRRRTGCRPTSIYLYEASVTGTETALLAAAAAPGVDRDSPRRVRAARRRAVRVPAASWARRRPASARRRIRDRRRRASCSGAEHRLWGDYIEAGSWAVVAAVTGGEIEVRGARAEDMEVVAAVLKRLNVDCAMDGDAVSRRAIDAAGGGPHHDRDSGRDSRAISSAS